VGIFIKCYPRLKYFNDNLEYNRSTVVWYNINAKILNTIK